MWTHLTVILFHYTTENSNRLEYIALGGFDPPTFELWIQHASKSAPQSILNQTSLLEKASKILFPFSKREVQVATGSAPVTSCWNTRCDTFSLHDHWCDWCAWQTPTHTHLISPYNLSSNYFFNDRYIPRHWAIARDNIKIILSQLLKLLCSISFFHEVTKKGIMVMI